jgi:predicted AAA+ superfamily ATPase
MTESPDRNSSHLAGEYFVAAELYRRGYSVGMTIGNAKAIDLFAEKDGRVIAVQVKAIRDKKSVGWPITRDRIRKDIIYVFVLLNKPGVKPDYFIATSAEAESKVKQYETRGIIDLSTLNSSDFLERWDKL